MAAYTYRTTEYLNGKELLIMQIREKLPGRGPVAWNDVTILGIVDSEPFKHTFGARSRAAEIARGYIKLIPIHATLTKRGIYVDLEILEPVESPEADWDKSCSQSLSAPPHRDLDIEGKIP